MNDEPTGLHYDAEFVRAWAFRLLLATHEPVSLAQLTSMSGLNVDRLGAAIEQLEREGRLRRDPAGRVIGSAGLTFEPTRHRIVIDGKVWWTWCAVDAVGILAALGRGGIIESACAQSGVPLTVQFTDGEPPTTPIVLFIADEATGGSLIDDWCPKNNFFCSKEAARDWAASSGVTGKIVSLREGAERTAERWRHCLASTDANPATESRS